MKKYYKFIVALFVGGLITWFSIVNYGVSIGIVTGPSMEPTFHDMDKVLVNRWTLLWRNPTKGEVVVIWNFLQNGNDIKRVVATPGDLVQTMDSNKKYKLGKNQYFVAGDNPTNSWDSRYYGPVHRKQILGIVKE